MNKILKLLCIIFMANTIFASEHLENADGNCVIDYKVFMDKHNTLFDLKFGKKLKFARLVQKAMYTQKIEQLNAALAKQKAENSTLAEQRELLGDKLATTQSKHVDLMHQLKMLNELLSQRDDALRIAQSEVHNLNKHKDAKDARLQHLAAQLLTFQQRNKNLEAQLATLRNEYEPIVIQKEPAKKK